MKRLDNVEMYKMWIDIIGIYDIDKISSIFCILWVIKIRNYIVDICIIVIVL